MGKTGERISDTLQNETYTGSMAQGRTKLTSSASIPRSLLVSLIERMALTSDKQIIIKFRFKQLEDG